MKKSNIIMIFLIFILLILIFLFKDSFNLLIKKILLITDKEIVYKDELTSNYIKYLENNIKKYENISSIDNCINSTVIYRNPTYWYNELTIDKGKNDNIEIGDLVINNEGVIGVVKKVYNNTSVINLISNIDKNSKITVGLTNGKDTIYGIIDSYNKIKNEFIVKELTSDITGDISVITTSFTNSYKEGLIIGKVINIKIDDDGLSSYAVVKSITNYNDIKYLCVIK